MITRVAVVGQRGQQCLAEVVADLLLDGQVEVGAVVEVAVEDGTGEARFVGDRLDLDVLAGTRTAPAPDRGVDDGPAARLVVRQPASGGRRAVSRSARPHLS